MTATLEGAPSLVLKVLTSLMLAIVAIAVIALVVNPGLIVAGALTTSGCIIASVGAVSTIAGVGFFAQSFKSSGLCKIVSEAADEQAPNQELPIFN